MVNLQSVFNQRGEGWVDQTLEEVSTTFGRGKSKHRPRNAKHLYGGEYPFVQTALPNRQALKAGRHALLTSVDLFPSNIQ